MEVLEAIRRRRAVRDYKPDQVPATVLRQLISAASWAPSAMNEQPWHFTVITDAKLLDETSRHSKAWMLQRVAAMPRSGHFRDILSDPHYHIFYHAPALIVISVADNCQWAAEDCALAAQNLMLAAQDQNFGTCWIGFAQGWLNTGEGRNALGLSAESRIVAPIIVGHPKAAPPPVPRKSPVVTWIGKIAAPPESKASPGTSHTGLTHF